MQAVYPVLTKIEPGTDSHGRANGLVLRSVAWVIIPVAVVVSALGAPLIHIVYGEKWLAVVPLLPWAVAEASLVAIAYAAYMLLLASQKQRFCLLSDAWVLAGTAASILLFVPLGLKYYLMGLIAVQGVTLILILFWLYHHRAATIPGMVSALIWPSVASACALVLCEGAARLAGADRTKLAIVAAYGACFVAGYVSILRLMVGAQLGELVRHFPYGGRLSRLLLLPQGRLAA
jgi:PST family polysaccharide transporter